jgi:hypothetical protein
MEDLTNVTCDDNNDAKLESNLNDLADVQIEEAKSTTDTLSHNCNKNIDEVSKAEELDLSKDQTESDEKSGLIINNSHADQKMLTRSQIK